MYSIGATHSWPNLLAMLAWMVDLIQCADRLNVSIEFDEQDASDDPEKFILRSFARYVFKAYREYLSHQDSDYSVAEEELAQSFGIHTTTLVEMEGCG